MLNVHILYEQGMDLRPHSSSYIRLLRPFSHPIVSKKIKVSSGLYLPTRKVDIVIIDRLWRYWDIDIVIAENLIKKIREMKSKIVYSFDDDLESWVSLKPGIPTKFREVFQLFLKNSDGILVTTDALRDKFSKVQSNAVVLPNMLDERLLLPIRKEKKKIDEVVIGYMGTITHQEDLEMIFDDLVNIYQKFKSKIRFELIGILNHCELDYIRSRGLQIFPLDPGNFIEYPLFMLWYGSRVSWDIGLAPLRDNEFNKFKSDIKLLDYAAIGAAGIFSKSNVYQTVLNFQNGIVVSEKRGNWSDAIEKIIVDYELRNRLQEAATDYLYEKRVLAKTAHLWIDAVEKIYEDS